ncbi:MAG: hypothetical protein GC150_07025 [Rhizobiales bacterium]|nr:hypothetical protein [Hyphomicrobiales bacterium]
MNDMALSLDGERRADDLPRSFRVAKDEQRRAAARAARESVLVGIDVPFWRLVGFFLKCALAALPALFLLALIAFALAEVADRMLPDWLKMQLMF